MKNIPAITGRPAISDNEIDIIFRKLEPYLRSGLTINKACIQAQIPKSTVFDLCKENRDFAEKIAIAKNHHSVLVSSILTRELEKIQKKQEKENLNRDELRFIMWTAMYDKSARDEFGIEVSVDEQQDKEKIVEILNDPNAFEMLFRVHELARKRKLESNSIHVNG